MFQQNNNPYGAAYPYYGAMPQQYVNGPMHPKNTQPLTNEQINALRTRGGSSFDPTIAQEDVWVAMCTHKNKDGSTSLRVVDATAGLYHCDICNEDFHLVEKSIDEVNALVLQMLDVLQTIKAVYGNISESLAENFFQIIPLLKKVPQLYKVAMDDINRYTDMPGVMQSSPYQGANLFSQFNSLIATPYMNNFQPYGYQGWQGGMPMQNQQPYGSTMMGQQPMGQPGYYNQAPMGNPFVGGMGMQNGYDPNMMQQNPNMAQQPGNYNPGMMGQQPQNNQFAQSAPQAPTPNVPQPGAPAPQGDVTTTKQFSV